MVITELNTEASELGEGIFIDEINSNLYWLDINRNNIYQYDLKAMYLKNCYKVSNNPSCIYFADDEQILYIDNEGTKRLCLQSEKVSTINAHKYHSSIDFRGNDGVKLADGKLVYGTMSYDPVSSAGRLYINDLCGKLIYCFEPGIHIPNTFIQVKDKLYISDSLKQKTYILDLTYISSKEKLTLELWQDFSGEKYTPDGGCLSQGGFLHIALWGGNAIGVFKDTGELVSMIDIPALQPTNCAIYKSRWLFVTTAKEGMSVHQLSNYPSSGKTFMIDLGENYEY